MLREAEWGAETSEGMSGRGDEVNKETRDGAKGLSMVSKNETSCLYLFCVKSNLISR